MNGPLKEQSTVFELISITCEVADDMVFELVQIPFLVNVKFDLDDCAMCFS